MWTSDPQVVIGLDVGGTCINATAWTGSETFLVDRMVEFPVASDKGPDEAVAALAEAMDLA